MIIREPNSKTDNVGTFFLEFIIASEESESSGIEFWVLGVHIVVYETFLSPVTVDFFFTAVAVRIEGYNAETKEAAAIKSSFYGEKGFFFFFN